MHWIYILRCDGNIIYIGETTRLFTRLREHKNGEGSITTQKNKPFELMGIYKLIDDWLTFDIPKRYCEEGFIEENKHWGRNLENEITLMYMKAMNTKWDNVYGGKYHQGYRPDNNPSNNIRLNRPYCNCKLPADINIYNDKIYWRCCRKNNWSKLNTFLEDKLKYSSLKPCNFYKEYKTNQEHKCENFIYGDPNDREKFINLIKKSSWLNNIPCDEEGEAPQCVHCDAYLWCDRNGNYKANGILYPYNSNDYDNVRLLCVNCFKNKNDELKKIYDPFRSGKCLIKI